jgi:hypothetical protein
VATTREAELTSPRALADSRGRLRPDAIGWARHPLWSCAIAGRRGRKKRWSYWAVQDARFFLALTIADLDYAGLATATLLEHRSARLSERALPSPLARGLAMPEGLAGTTRFEGLDLHVAMHDDGRDVRLEARFAGVVADVRVRRPEGRETLNVVVPWSPERYQYTSKQIGLPCEGTVRGRDEWYTLGPDARASLDFGRGVWPYRTAWNWGAASGASDGVEIAINLGGRWTRGTGMTENGVAVGGRLHKIGEELTFLRDPRRPDAPWRVRDDGGERVDLVFTPRSTRDVRVPLGIVSSELHHAIGTYDGDVVLDDGARLRVQGLRGWAEEHRARW